MSVEGAHCGFIPFVRRRNSKTRSSRAMNAFTFIPAPARCWLRPDLPKRDWARFGSNALCLPVDTGASMRSITFSFSQFFDVVIKDCIEIKIPGACNGREVVLQIPEFTQHFFRI